MSIKIFLSVLAVILIAVLVVVLLVFVLVLIVVLIRHNFSLLGHFARFYNVQFSRIYPNNFYEKAKNVLKITIFVL